MHHRVLKIRNFNPSPSEDHSKYGNENTKMIVKIKQKNSCTKTKFKAKNTNKNILLNEKSE